MQNDRRKRLQKELESIRRIRSINGVIDRSNAENTLLYTSSRENEPLSETVVDNLLERITKGKGAEEDIKIVESLTKEGKDARITKHRHVTISPANRKGARLKRKVHMIKHRKPKGPAGKHTIKIKKVQRAPGKRKR